MSARESMSAVLLVALRLLTDNQHQCQAATDRRWCGPYPRMSLKGSGTLEDGGLLDLAAPDFTRALILMTCLSLSLSPKCCKYKPKSM